MAEEDTFEMLPAAAYGPLMTTVRSVLDRYEYRYRALDARTLSLSITSDHGISWLLFTVVDETHFFRVHGSYGSYVPDDRRVATAEAVSRINCRLGLGNFELDFDDGELRFRSSLDVEDGALSETMVDKMMSYTLYTMDRFHTALMSVAFGSVEPAVAVAAVE
jgi:hypothetical protein